MKTILIALACLLSGCAAVTSQPRVIFTPEDDLIVQQGTQCWKVGTIDYDDLNADPDDLAYASLTVIACPVERRSR